MMYTLLLASLLLLQPAEPSPLPARMPKTGGIYVVAHRGVHDGIPENTLTAYRKAIELGADFIEIDVRETKDGALVSIHNHTVDDYTKDATGPVNTFTLEELQNLDIGSRVGPEWANERIPTLEDILKLCRGRIGIYLDLKQADVNRVAALIQKYGMTGDVFWYAGGPHLRQLKKCFPDCIPMPDPGPEKNLGRLLSEFTPRVVASTWDQLTETFVTACHAGGALVIVDDDGPETWEAMLDWGVDGIQTNEVSALIEVLRARAVQPFPVTTPKESNP